MVTFPERGKQTPDHRGNSEGTPKQNSLETLYRGLARVRGRGVRVCLDSGPPPPACGAVRGWGAGESVEMGVAEGEGELAWTGRGLCRDGIGVGMTPRF